MKQSGIVVITLVCVLGCCVLGSATAFGECITSLSLDIEILPNGTYNPQDICESRPLNLRFKYQKCDGTQNLTYSLRSLEYSVFNENEGAPFFKDILMLTDNTLPNAKDISPGIYIPPDSTKIRVSAKLNYFDYKEEDATAEMETAVTAAVSPDYIIGGIYDRMRDGYIRRHILDAGRGLSWLWLKEYEPCLDNKELLRHSRTFKAEGQTRVYVPWIYKCNCPADQSTADQCGDSVQNCSDVIYGGDENPLLRGGLAMATFALDYIAFGRPDSLNHAMKLFEYIEKSEWRDPATGHLTGFFLRSRWPGNIHEKTQRQYFYASVDELSGMSLGMLYLSYAIAKASMDKPPGLDLYKVVGVWSRLQSLTDRLGSQLRNNFYLIVPLKKQGNTWAPIGLPVEFQKGAFGAYPWQWFFLRGFGFITGNDYTISGGLFQDLSDFIVYGGSIPHAADGGEDESLLDKFSSWGLGKVLESLQSQISPYDLAIGSIQGLGITMYNRGKDWKFPVPCAPDITVKIKEDDVKRFNYAMLLHVYQLAQLYSPTEDEEKGVELEMARLVNGILTSGEKTKLNIPDFLLDIYSAAVFLVTGIPLPSFIWDWFCNTSPEVTIGSPGREIDSLDIYSAAVAVAYNLPRRYSNHDKWQEYWDSIWRVLGNAPSIFWKSLPLGERDVNVISHNPSNAWGNAFCWEGYGPCIVGGGGCDKDCEKRLGSCEKCWDNGLPDSEIAAKYQLSRPIDSMREGAGLDYLLPWSLYFAHTDQEKKDVMSQRLHNYEGPYLQACTTNPVSLALADQGRSDAWFFSKCSHSYPRTTYTLSVEIIPPEGGIVQLIPRGGCYPPGFKVTLYPAASHNFTFDSWEGVDSIDGSDAYVTMNGDRTVKAKFARMRVHFFPTSNSHGPGSETGSFEVIPPHIDYSWTAFTETAWIKITSGSNGTGSGTVYYTVSANPGPATRIGQIVVDGEGFIITQWAASTCSPRPSLSPGSRNHGWEAAAGSVNVIAPSGCNWTAASNAYWVTITSGSSGTANGTVNYSVSENSYPFSRTGTLTIGGQNFTITQDAPPSGPCTFSLSPTSRNHGSGIGTGSVDVVVSSIACGSWTAVSNASWITITSGSSGNIHNHTINYSVSANPGPGSRSGTITINMNTPMFALPDKAKGPIPTSMHKTFTVTQDAPSTSCTYSFSPTSRNHGSGAEIGSVSVTAPSGCNWTASSNVNWIAITSGSSGVGSGTVNYSVLANPGPNSRTGTVTVAGQVFTVTQAAPSCTYTISPTSRSHGSSGETGSVSVIAPIACDWTATSSVNWITITSGSNGTGNGTVYYSVSANSGPGSRTGTLIIAGRTFTVIQGGVSFHWTPMSLPSVSSDWSLLRMQSTSPNEGRAVGYDNTNRRGALLYYSGGTWISVTMPFVSSDWDLQAIHFTSPNEGWAVGFDAANHRGVLLHYSGGAWTSVSPSSLSSLWYLCGIHFTSPNEGWAVGGNTANSRGSLLHYSGGIWTSVTPPFVSSNWYLRGVYFTSSNEGWAVGTNKADGKGVLLHYSGGSWTSVSPPSVSSDWWLLGLHFTSPSEGWAVGHDETTGTGVLLHYAGSAWTSVSPPSLSSHWWVRGVYFTSPNEGWAAGGESTNNSGVMLHYSGGSWTLESLPSVSSDWELWGIHFASPNEGWAVGTDGINKKGVLFHLESPSPIFPNEGTVGSEFTIKGSGFGTRKNKVIIGNTALKILEWTDGSIRCSIPKALPPGSYDVVVQPYKASSITFEKVFIIQTPQIDSVEPSSGSTNEVITVDGSFFGSKKGKVTLGGKSCKVLSWTMDSTTGVSEIRFVVPKGLTSGVKELKVTNAVESDTTTFTVE